MRIAVIGAGKMGLPLACAFASRGGVVTACDPDRGVVDAINRGEPPFDEPGMTDLLEHAVADGRLRATTDNRAGIAGAEVCVILVPVKLLPTREADLSIMESIAADLAASVSPGTLVAFETTLPVGTTRRLAGAIAQGGLRVGDDFHVVFSPERVKSRLVLRHLFEHPKIVGGYDVRSTARGVDFYERYLGAPVIEVGSLEAAELAKLAGMAYRDVNIALANELARYAEQVGIDFEPVRRAANTDGESAILVPGIGVGGHCTPVYPHFLLQDAERAETLELTRVGRKVNEAQPGRVLDRIGSFEGRTVLILGVAFRPGVKEASYSPAFALREEIVRRGGRPTALDPMFSLAELRDLGFEVGSLTDGSYAVVLQTGHPEFQKVDFLAMARAGTRIVVDGRRFWERHAVEAAGLTYLGVGVPGSAGNELHQCASG